MCGCKVHEREIKLTNDKIVSAEDYHQDYYLTESEWYYYYKDRCGR